MIQDVLDVALLVAEAIDATGSEYFVGGYPFTPLRGAVQRAHGCFGG